MLWLYRLHSSGKKEETSKINLKIKNKKGEKKERKYLIEYSVENSLVHLVYRL
jgi:hypothetical protein